MPDAAFQLPAGITEADLIDLVDGVALHPSREAAVLAALKAEPRLGLLIKQLRDDRGGLMNLGEVHAPLGLAEGIEARLEQDAIRSLAQAEETTTDAIPISAVRIETPGAWQVLLESAWPRRLATAASLAIVGSLVYFGGREAIRAWPNVMGGPGGPNVVVKPKPDHGTPGLDAAPSPAPIEVATGPTDGPDGPNSAAAMTSIAAHTPDAPVADVPLTVEQAAALARQGRLAISVRAPRDVASTLKNVDAIARNAGRDATWRGVGIDQVPTELAFLSTPTMIVPGASSPAHPDAPAIAVASAEGSSPTPTPSAKTAPAHLADARHAVVKAIYTVDIDPTDAAITRLVESLKSASSLTQGTLAPGAEIVLRKLETPVERPVSFEPEDILWWANQPSAWAKLSTIPIVIETLE